jgi:hypothetical protein
LKIQLREALQWIDALDQIDVAYEPVRAIGTGKSATPEEVQDIHEYIRSVLGNEKSRIIYGGSVNDTNAEFNLTTCNQWFPHRLSQDPQCSRFLIGSAYFSFGSSKTSQKFSIIITKICFLCEESLKNI